MSLFSIAFIITLVMGILKVMGFLAVSWWFVMIPLFAWVAILFISVVVVFLFFA